MGLLLAASFHLRPVWFFGLLVAGEGVVPQGARFQHDNCHVEIMLVSRFSEVIFVQANTLPGKFPKTGALTSCCPLTRVMPAQTSLFPSNQEGYLRGRNLSNQLQTAVSTSK